MSGPVENAAGINVLEEKMLKDLKAGNSYEALQYVQSFIARKKKTIKPIIVSDMVFHASKLLIGYESAPYAGTLLLWYMEGGAGDDNVFHVEKGSLENTFCDLDRLTLLLTANSVEKSSSIVEAIQKPLLAMVENFPISREASFDSRIKSLEVISADLFESAGNWRMAFKFRLRLGDMKRLAKTLDLWASDAYPTERPLFFSRAILHLLANEQRDLALDLVQAASAYIIETNLPTIAAWHFSQMTCELLDLPGDPNIKKSGIYDVLSKKYYDTIVKLDDKLGPLIIRIGIQCFGCNPPANSAMNPFAMLEALTGGKKSADGSLDMSNLMNMISGIQGGKKK